MSALGDKIEELKAEIKQAVSKGNNARVRELLSQLERLEKEYKEKKNAEQHGITTPIQKPQKAPGTILEQNIYKNTPADRKAVRELFWDSGNLDSEVPEIKNKSFTR